MNIRINEICNKNNEELNTLISNLTGVEKDYISMSLYDVLQEINIKFKELDIESQNQFADELWGKGSLENFKLNLLELGE